MLCDFFFFFFKQKTAYEMRISDWSSDVCSSDLSRREWLFRQAMRLTDVAVAVSKAAGQRLVELKSTPPDKLRIVPNGIHAGPFRERNDAERARLAGSLGLPSTTKLVGFVGRLNWAKDLVILVDAFARVCASRSDAALVLVGEGEERAAIEAALARAGIGDRVFLLGDRGDVPAPLPAFSMFAMSRSTRLNS